MRDVQQNLQHKHQLSSQRTSPDYFKPEQKPLLFFLDHLSVHYGVIRALDSVQLKIHLGDFLFITGSSGAGKSTLLRVLQSEEKNYHGRFDNHLSGQIQDGIVCSIFQDLKLVMNFTCKENLWMAYDPDVHNHKKDFEDDLIELCKLFQIQDRLHLKVSKVNGGMKQMIAIIRTLLARPSVILADEPTASLDPENAMKLFDILQFYHKKRGVTVIWASHDRELVKKFSGKMIHLSQGKIIHSGHACFI